MASLQYIQGRGAYCPVETVNFRLIYKKQFMIFETFLLILSVKVPKRTQTTFLLYGHTFLNLKFVMMGITKL